MSKKNLTYISEESPEQGGKLEKLKKQLKVCQKEKEEYLTQAQRARADLINYQRRQEQALEELKRYGQAGLARELLPIMDSLEIGAGKDENIKLIRDQFWGILKNYQLEEIKSVGQKFNPQIHEAVEQVESEKEEGIIIEEIQKGYLLGDKVLRPSRVKVAK